MPAHHANAVYIHIPFSWPRHTWHSLFAHSIFPAAIQLHTKHTHARDLIVLFSRLLFTVFHFALKGKRANWRKAKIIKQKSWKWIGLAPSCRIHTHTHTVENLVRFSRKSFATAAATAAAVAARQPASLPARVPFHTIKGTKNICTNINSHAP